MNEGQVGEGIRSSDISREDIFVTTKLWIGDYRYDRTFHAFDQSLRKLGRQGTNLPGGRAVGSTCT
jgi:2,5-diketo-D-gluconate reductase A